MNYQFRVLAFLLACVVCLMTPLLGGCVDPTAPDDLGTPQPLPPDPDPVPDPQPEPEEPVISSFTVTIDFQSAVPGIVAEGFSAVGFGTPAQPGELDATSWSVLGFSDGDLPFGTTAASGDFARGISSGGVSTGGIYAFQVGTDDYALGVQPTASDFAPGSIILKLIAPESQLHECQLAFTVWSRNDQDRSTVWTPFYSPDGIEWVEIPAMAFATPEVADGAPEWSATTLNGTVDLLDRPLAGDNGFYLRWDAADGGGEGSRDESAIDDITATFTYALQPGQ